MAQINSNVATGHSMLLPLHVFNWT